MISLSFLHPRYLLLLLLVPLVVLAWFDPRLGRWRRWFSAALRTLILLALILALSGMQLVWPARGGTTIFLLDSSASVAPAQRARAEGFLSEALAQLPVDARAALVVFGRSALVERPPLPQNTLGQISVAPDPSATDIAAALQLGTALLPAEDGQRVVLLSDGGETLGDGLAAAQQAAAAGIPIDVVPLSSGTAGPDAQISALELPSSVRRGQQLVLKVRIDSSVAGEARLILRGPADQVIYDAPVTLRAGTQTLELNLPEPASRFARYTAQIVLPGDVRVENDRAEAFTFVNSQPQVLLVQGSPGAADNLTAALRAARIETRVVESAQIPPSLGDLSNFDAVVLIDVPKQAIPARTQSALAAYVHDLGRGLLMVGGSQSFGAGGWRDTPVEAALPVSMDVPSRFRRPPVSIVLLVDVSGSMAAVENGRTKLSLAAEGAQRIAALMRDEDELTVIGFDTDVNSQIGPIPGSQRNDAINGMSRLQPGGGGIEIYDGLQAAAKIVRASQKPVKHIITLTDGGDTEQQEGANDLIRQLRNEAVTVTTIAIGDGSDVPFLREAARVGAGRSFLTDQASTLPTILADETQVILRPYLIEQPVAPVQTAVHPILRDLNQVPQLAGYVLTTPKENSQVLLATPEGEPLLALWQHGLGRSAAWTSDLRGQWAQQWVANWEPFPLFVARLVGWLLPQQAASNLSLTTTPVGDAISMSVNAYDANNQPQPGLTVRGRLAGGDGRGIEVEFREIAPGEYRATAANLPPGAYLAQILAVDAGGQSFGGLTGGLVAPPSAEFRARSGNLGLLEAIARISGGRVNPQPTQVFDPGARGRGLTREIGWWLLVFALLLLPVDIAVRRLVFKNRQQAVRIFRPEPQRQPVEPTPTPKPPPMVREDELARLREAQERARKRARGEE